MTLWGITGLAHKNYIAIKKAETPFSKDFGFLFFFI